MSLVEKSDTGCVLEKLCESLARVASYVRALMPRLAQKAGVEKRVHPHGLRHTCAAELALEGMPVPLIQQQLGHASLHTTTVYMRHIAAVELVETMRRRTWGL